jgi:hypothetical protein
MDSNFIKYYLSRIQDTFIIIKTIIVSTVVKLKIH